MHVTTQERVELQILVGHAHHVAHIIEANTTDLPTSRREGTQAAVRYLRSHVEFLC
jgi:hypothetical protein